MKDFNTLADERDYQSSQSNLTNQQQQQQSVRHPATQLSAANSQHQLVVDEMQQDLTYLSRDAPLDGGESTFGGAYSQLGLDQTPMTRDELLTLSRQNNDTTSNNHHSSHSALYANGSEMEQQQRHLLDEEENRLRQEFSQSPNELLQLDSMAPDNVDITTTTSQQAATMQQAG